MQLLDKFHTIQDHIEALLTHILEEKPWGQFRKSFEVMYFDVTGKVRGYIGRFETLLSTSHVQPNLRLISAFTASSEIQKYKETLKKLLLNLLIFTISRNNGCISGIHLNRRLTARNYSAIRGYLTRGNDIEWKKFLSPINRTIQTWIDRMIVHAALINKYLFDKQEHSICEK